MWVQSLVREDTLEEEMATHSSILAWKIPWAEESGGYSPWSRTESDRIEYAHMHVGLISALKDNFSFL